MNKITATDIPATLNGYPVKGFSMNPNGETALVLCLREGMQDAWVAATWWPELGDGWQWGNYFASYEQADAYRGRWIRTKHADFDDAPRVKLEGRIGGWQS